MPRIAAVARKQFSVRRIEEGRRDVLLGVQRREKFLGRVRIVKGERRGAIGAKDVRQHLHVVAHRVAALHLIVDQQRRAAEQRGDQPHQHAGQLNLLGHRKIPVIGRHSHGCLFDDLRQAEQLRADLQAAALGRSRGRFECARAALAVWNAMIPPSGREVVGFSHRQNGRAFQRIEQSANPFPLRAPINRIWHPLACWVSGSRRTAKARSPIFLPCTMILQRRAEGILAGNADPDRVSWSSRRCPAAIPRIWQSCKETRPSPDTHRTRRGAWARKLERGAQQQEQTEHASHVSGA